MKTIPINNEIIQPEIEDYGTEYPKMPCNTDKKQAIFDIITNPTNIQRALIIAEEIGCSPIVLYENKLKSAIDAGELTPLTWHEKQFVGAVVRVVMEFNDWERTGRKQRFTNKIFSSAERYKKVEDY